MAVVRVDIMSIPCRGRWMAQRITRRPQAKYRRNTPRADVVAHRHERSIQSHIFVSN
ncbi:hypothetical protein [Paraburkholderia sp.]|uniref:hypothetical protein n=1 Tax=Paraburkholderia sp. TaxID=1926495 RepID=UPI003D6F2639